MCTDYVLLFVIILFTLCIIWLQRSTVKKDQSLLQGLCSLHKCIIHWIHCCVEGGVTKSSVHVCAVLGENNCLMGCWSTLWILHNTIPVPWSLSNFTKGFEKKLSFADVCAWLDCYKTLRLLLEALLSKSPSPPTSFVSHVQILSVWVWVIYLVSCASSFCSPMFLDSWYSRCTEQLL